MKIKLTEELWNSINPEFDGHTGLVGEDGNSYTPAWYPLPDILICPVMQFTPKDIGRKYRKVFYVQREEIEKTFIFVVGSVDEIEITDKNIFAYYEGKRHIIDAENTVVMRDRC